MVLADRNSRRLIFSIKAKEKEELVEKKRILMVTTLPCLKLAIFLLIRFPAGYFSNFRASIVFGISFSMLNWL